MDDAKSIVPETLTVSQDTITTKQEQGDSPSQAQGGDVLKFNCFYQIKHDYLPPNVPDKLKAARVVMITFKNLTYDTVVVNYADADAVHAFISSPTVFAGPYLCVVPYPELKGCSVLDNKFAQKLLFREISEEEYDKRKHSMDFWLVGGMESYDESSEPKKTRVYWKDIYVKTLLEGCIQEMAATGIQGSSLKMHSWNKIGDTLKSTHNFIVNQRQMKNQFDYLREKYVVWSRLMNKMGNLYNPTTNTFNLTEEEWQAEAKLSKFADKLRNAPLLYPHLCKQVFNGVAATGSGSWGSWSNLPNPSRAPNVSNLHLLVDDESLHTTQVPPVSDQAPPMSNQAPSSSTQECSSCSQTRKRKANQPLVREEELAYVVTHVKAIFDKPSEDDDIGACILKLDRLGWEDTPLYDITLFLFSKGVDYRKIWLCLKDEKCKSWIEFTARQLKLM